MADGWIKLHRSTAKSCAWNSLSPEGKCVMLAILLGCNYHDSDVILEGERRKIKAGQWLTSIKSIQKLAGNGISDRNIRTSLDVLQKCDFLTNETTKGNHRIITINNWLFYQSDQQDDKGNDKRPTNDRQTTDRIQRKEELKELKDKYISSFSNPDDSDEIPDVYISIFDHWNQQRGLTAHRKFAGSIKERITRVINGRLSEGYNQADIINAISNYAEVFNGEQYFFKYGWTLEEFLKRSGGFPKFVDEANPKVNFLKDKNTNKEQVNRREPEPYEGKVYSFLDVPDNYLQPHEVKEKHRILAERSKNEQAGK